MGNIIGIIQKTTGCSFFIVAATTFEICDAAYHISNEVR